MVTSKAEQILDDWATAWSSHDPERVLALFDNDCVYEDATFGAVNRCRQRLSRRAMHSMSKRKNTRAISKSRKPSLQVFDL